MNINDLNNLFGTIEKNSANGSFEIFFETVIISVEKC